jgi:hypothetical protein
MDVKLNKNRVLKFEVAAILNKDLIPVHLQLIHHANVNKF